MEGVREPLQTGTLLGVHNTCGSRVRFFSHGRSTAGLRACTSAVMPKLLETSVSDRGTLRGLTQFQRR